MLDTIEKDRTRVALSKSVSETFSVEFEEERRRIAEFLEFARSRPSNHELAQAIANIVSLPRHAVITAELGNALLEVRDLYPGMDFIELRLALLPTLLDDSYRASALIEQFVKRFPTNPWGYMHGIKTSAAANLYQRVDQIASRALENLDKLAPFGPAQFYGLLVQAAEIGRHPLFFELCNRFSGWLKDLPEYRAYRLTCTAENLQTEAYDRIAFVSLGTNCLPWTIGNRWGFRSVLTDDRHQLPLNYGQQTVKTCSMMLADSFAKLRCSGEYALVRGQYGFDIAMHKAYGLLFNHEVGQYWLTQGCKNLMRRYRKRAANFLEHATAGPRVYVLYLPWRANVSTVESYIAELSADQNYRLLVIDSRAAANDANANHPNTIWRQVSLPHQDYVWWQHFDTEEGVRFEAAIHDAMRDAARELST